MKNRVVMKIGATLTIALTVLLGSGLVGCDLLEQVPDSEITEGNFWQTAGDAEAAVTGAYDQLQNVLGDINFIHWGDIRSGIIGPGERASNNSRLVLANQLNADVSGSDWGGFYRGISRANYILANLSGIEDGSLTLQHREALRGEALFLRSLNYFWVVRLWGDAPLITEPYVSGDQEFQVPRDDKNLVLDQLEADLQEAVQLLPAVRASGVEMRGRATKGAARALLAHVYAWRGKHQLAADAAQEVITSGMYSLVPGDAYATLFVEGNTSESIFELQFDIGQQELQDVGEQYILLPYGGITNWPDFYASEEYLEAFEPDDVRRSATVYEDVGPANYDMVAKYLGSGEGTTNVSDSNIILFRLADMILLRAEALNNLGRQAEARDLLNQIRARAGLPPAEVSSQTELKQAILKERMIELGFEGHYWFDLIRNGEALNRVDALINEEHILWPISRDELNTNSKLAQNTFYR